jgi:hypothetical protein
MEQNADDPWTLADFQDEECVHGVVLIEDTMPDSSQDDNVESEMVVDQAPT